MLGNFGIHSYWYRSLRCFDWFLGFAGLGLGLILVLGSSSDWGTSKSYRLWTVGPSFKARAVLQPAFRPGPVLLSCSFLHLVRFPKHLRSTQIPWWARPAES